MSGAAATARAQESDIIRGKVSGPDSLPLENVKVTARDRMQHFDAYMNPATHQMQQTIYMATYNDQPKVKDDIFKILTQSEPKDVMDADAPKACKLEPYEATPTYEM